MNRGERTCLGCYHVKQTCNAKPPLGTPAQNAACSPELGIRANTINELIKRGWIAPDAWRQWFTEGCTYFSIWIYSDIVLKKNRALIDKAEGDHAWSRRSAPRCRRPVPQVRADRGQR